MRNVFGPDGKLNEEVLAPAVDKKKLFEPKNEDIKYSWMIYVGLGGLALFLCGILGIVYDVVAPLAIPVVMSILGFLAVIVAIWVWYDAENV